MKKLLIGLIFLGFTAVAFCSSGWMANVMNSMHAHGDERVSQCCDYEAVNHQTEEITAVFPMLKSFDLPGVVLILLVALMLFHYRVPNIDHFYLPNFYQRFSRGVFQLE